MRMHAQIHRLGNPDYVTDKREKLEVENDRIKWVDIDVHVRAWKILLTIEHSLRAPIVCYLQQDWTELYLFLSFCRLQIKVPKFVSA